MQTLFTRPAPPATVPLGICLVLLLLALPLVTRLVSFRNQDQGRASGAGPAPSPVSAASPPAE